MKIIEIQRILITLYRVLLDTLQNTLKRHQDTVFWIDFDLGIIKECQCSTCTKKPTQHAAHCQTFLKTVKDPDRESDLAHPSSKSWCKAEARQRSSELVTVIQYLAARSLRCPVLYHTQLQETPSSHCSDRAENGGSPPDLIP